MKTVEEQVREFWPNAKTGDGFIYLYCNADVEICAVFHDWEAALAFTNQRKREIAECSNCLQWVRVAGTTTMVVDGYRAYQQAAINYMLILLEARLAELKRGTVLEKKEPIK